MKFRKKPVVIDAVRWDGESIAAKREELRRLEAAAVAYVGAVVPQAVFAENRS